MKRKKSKHFKKPLKPIQVEAVGLPNNVRIGYKDVKIVDDLSNVTLPFDYASFDCVICKDVSTF